MAEYHSFIHITEKCTSFSLLCACSLLAHCTVLEEVLGSPSLCDHPLIKPPPPSTLFFKLKKPHSCSHSSHGSQFLPLTLLPLLFSKLFLVFLRWESPVYTVFKKQVQHGLMLRRDNVLHFVPGSLALPKLWFLLLSITVHGADVSTELQDLTSKE